MTFPAPYETPATLYARKLQESSASVSVYTLLPKSRDAERLLNERDLGTLEIVWPTFYALLLGLGYGLRHPKVFFGLLKWIVQVTQGRQRQKSFILIPSALYIFSRLQKRRPEIVHLNLGHYPCLVGYLVLEFLPSTQLTLSLGAYDMLRRYGGTAFVAQRARWVRVLSGTSVSYVKEAYGVPTSRIKVIFDGIDLVACESSYALQPKMSCRILTASKLVEQKGVDTTLRVFRKVLKTVPRAQLVVCGDGPDRQRIEALARELGLDTAVTFLGHVSQAALFNEMAKAELFLFMSRYPPERLPNVVKEAVACRCLCVVSETPGIEELVKPGEHAFIVDPLDIEGGAANVVRALTQVQEREAMVAAAFSHLREHFSIERIVTQYLTAWGCATPKFIKRVQ